MDDLNVNWQGVVVLVMVILFFVTNILLFFAWLDKKLGYVSPKSSKRRKELVYPAWASISSRFYTTDKAGDPRSFFKRQLTAWFGVSDAEAENLIPSTFVMVDGWSFELSSPDHKVVFKVTKYLDGNEWFFELIKPNEVKLKEYGVLTNE